MRHRRIAGVVWLFLVVSAAGWLVLDWYHLFGEPVSASRVVITASLDTDLRLEGGSVVATGGQYVRAGKRHGQWLVTNGLPLTLIVLAAMVPASRLLFGPEHRPGRVR